MRRTLFTFLSAIALVATGVVGAIAVGGTGTVDPPPKIAFLANGIVPADALAAGGIAGQLGAPLFTTPASSLNDDARDGIKAYDPDLVIALGGPVAINDSVLTALSAATGLSIVTTTAPDDGIVRVAGGDRFATARAVAGLLAAYDPAYLPVDATALGALDATTADMASEADNSDTLDGLDSTDFGLASVPDGETLLGVWSFDIAKPDVGGDFGLQILFSTPLASPPSEYRFVEEGATVTGCPGTAEAPEADPGVLCVYEFYGGGFDYNETDCFEIFNLGDDLNRYGAECLFDNNGAAGDGYASGSFAANVAPFVAPRSAGAAHKR